MADHNSSMIFNGELFYGLQFAYPYYAGQFGLALAGATNARLTGDVWQDADPDFNNFGYSYKVNHVHLAVKAKIITGYSYYVQPYISGSFGVGFNRAYGFTYNPFISNVVPPPAFTANTTTAFTYTLGIGIQKSIDCHWSAGVGYEFADWGKSSLSPASGQTTNGAPSMNHLYTNALQLNVSYQL